MDKRGNISSRNMRLFAAIMTLIEALVLISLAGCAGKKVDYGVDTEVKSQNVVSSVKDIDTNTSFNDELTVNVGGTDEKVKITADIRVPECDTMSVTEVERIPCTKEFKEKVRIMYIRRGMCIEPYGAMRLNIRLAQMM